MPKIFSLEKPTKEKQEKLKSELREFPKIHPELTCFWSLSKEREEALEMIKQEKMSKEAILNLLKSPDFIENRAALYILSRAKNIPPELQEEIFPFLEKFVVESRDDELQGRALRTLAKIPESLPFLKELIEDEKYEPWRSQSTANQSLAIEIVGNIGTPEAKSFLKKLTRSEDWWVKDEAVKALGGQPAPPEEVIEEKQDSEEKGYQWLLATQKPLFATPFTPELAKRITELTEVEKKLRKKVGKKLVGIVVFGSTAKGYLSSLSDVDYTVVAEDYKVVKEFKKLAEPLFTLCHEQWVGPVKGEISGYTNALFNGLFFGDRKKLLEYQKNFLEQTDDKKWDLIRKIIMTGETDILKTKRILGLEEKEFNKTREAIALLRTPPMRKKALEIIEERLKN